MLRMMKTGAAWAALLAALAMPVGIVAIPLGVLAQEAPSLQLLATSGAFAGKWVYRSFDISNDPRKSLGNIALGQSELTLTESNGAVTGTRTGQGATYELSGVARYAPKQGATIRLHGTATISGKTYNYDYFGYLIPSWSVSTKLPDTILGTVLRSDPANPNNAPVIASWSAVRE
ncbi:MAG TPA: hypothetical protein VG757_12605 [Devosia sp.]|nr:hypothetical protein [Devosia sp.]